MNIDVGLELSRFDYDQLKGIRSRGSPYTPEMRFDLTSRLLPEQAALLVFECQDGVIGSESHLPSLAAAANDVKLTENIAGLLRAARESRARVFYSKVTKRADGIGDPINTPLMIRLQAQNPDAAGVPDMGEIVSELAPRDGDIVVSREHGMTGFYENGLDSYLRNTGVQTIVLTGVSVNIGILGTAIEAVNRGYTVIVPTDCVAGDPPEYAQQALQYSMRNLAFLSSRAEIERAWANNTANERRSGPPSRTKNP